MLLSMLLVLSAVPVQSFQTDTTFAVPQGARLHVENQGGDITIRGWDRNQIRVQASHSRRTRIDILVSPAVVRLEAEADRGPANMVDYQITVPAWMALDLEGLYTIIDVTGVRGAITAETVDGDITVKGPAESVKLETVQGKLVVQGVRGATTLTSISESIEASDIQGPIIASSVSGSVALWRIVSRSVEVETVSGELVFEGRIADGGQYALLTHSGSINMAVPEGTNATITTAVGSGEVRARFTVESPERSSRRRQVFKVGSGSATVELESFSGPITLMRPADLAERLDRMTRAREEGGKEKPKPKPEHDYHDGLDPATTEKRGS